MVVATGFVPSRGACAARCLRPSVRPLPPPAAGSGRGDWIRTSDISLPKRALYQAEPRPVSHIMPPLFPQAPVAPDSMTGRAHAGGGARMSAFAAHLRDRQRPAPRGVRYPDSWLATSSPALPASSARRWPSSCARAGTRWWRSCARPTRRRCWPSSAANCRWATSPSPTRCARACRAWTASSTWRRGTRPAHRMPAVWPSGPTSRALVTCSTRCAKRGWRGGSTPARWPSSPTPTACWWTRPTASPDRTCPSTTRPNGGRTTR